MSEKYYAIVDRLKVYILPDKAIDRASWHNYPADTGDIPRVTEQNNHRAQRLKRIGNGQVPQALVLAWRELYM